MASFRAKQPLQRAPKATTLGRHTRLLPVLRPGPGAGQAQDPLVPLSVGEQALFLIRVLCAARWPRSLVGISYVVLRKTGAPAFGEDL